MEKYQIIKARRILTHVINWDKNSVLEFLSKPLDLKGIIEVGLTTRIELIDYFIGIDVNHYSLFGSKAYSNLPTPNFLDNTNDHFFDLLKAINKHESDLSTRARNALKEILKRNYYIIDIFLDNSKIRRLKSVGLKTEIELFGFIINVLIAIKRSKILEKDQLGTSDYPPRAEVNNSCQLFNEMTIHLKPYKENIVAFLVEAAESLPTRAANGIRKVIKKDFYEICCYLTGSKEIISIEGVGKKHENEIKKTFDSCLSYVNSIIETNGADSQEENDNIDSQEITDETDLKDPFNELLAFFLSERNVHNFLYRSKQNDSGFIPLYSFISEILKSNYFMKKRDRNIFFHYIGLFGHQKLQRKNIACKHQLSKERVRQILDKVNRDIYSKNRSFLTHIRFSKIVSNYELYDGLFGDSVLVDSVFVENINRIENTNFSINEVSFITTLLLDNAYETFDEVNFEKPENLFIKKELFEIFNFRIFLTDMKQNVYAKSETSSELEFDDYLSKYLIKKDINSINRIKPICEELIKKTLRSTIYHVLKKKGRPMKIFELMKHVKVRLPEHVVSDESIRTTIICNSEFGTIDRESIYYLKEWTHGKIENF